MAGPCSILMDFDYTKAKLCKIRPFSWYVCSEKTLFCSEKNLLCSEKILLFSEKTPLCSEKTPFCFGKTALCSSKTLLCSEKNLLCSEKSLLCSAGAWGAVLPRGLHHKSQILQFYTIFTLNPRPASAQCPGKALVCQKNILPCVHFPAGAFFLEKKSLSEKLLY